MKRSEKEECILNKVRLFPALAGLKVFFVMEVIVIAGIVIGIGAPVSAEFNGKWYNETVVTGVPNPYYTSLAVKSNGGPCISFTGSPFAFDVYYAWKNSTGWHNVTVNTDSLYLAPLVLKNSNRPYIAFSKIRSRGSMMTDLILKTKKGHHGCKWGAADYVRRATEDTETAGADISLVLGSNGYPRVLYTRQWYHSIPLIEQYWVQHLDYAYKDANGWHREKIIEFQGLEPNIMNRNSLALGPGEEPRILYIETISGEDHLIYRHRHSSGDWPFEVIDGHTLTEGGFSLVTGPGGLPAVSYITQLTGSLIYTTKNSPNGLWQPEIVDTGISGPATCSLGFDPDGNPHISYNTGPTNFYLKHAWKDELGWHTEVVDGERYMDVGSGNSLAMRSDGSPRISYFDSTNGELKYAWFVYAPSVTAASPGSAEVGTTVDMTIWGEHFVKSFVQGGTKVTLEREGEKRPITAEFVLVRNSKKLSCRFRIPATAGSGEWSLVVKNPDGQEAYWWFTINSAEAPTITGITPDNGAVGSTARIVSLRGDNFMDGAEVVLAPGTTTPIQGEDVHWISSTNLTCTFAIPEGYDTGQKTVKVINPDRQFGEAPQLFRVTDGQPTVSGITPDHGPRGSVVEITELRGTKFMDGATVVLAPAADDPIAGENVVFVSPEKLTCRFTIPAGFATGLKNVKVTNPNGLSAKAQIFTIT